MPSFTFSYRSRVIRSRSAPAPLGIAMRPSPPHNGTLRFCQSSIVAPRGIEDNDKMESLGIYEIAPEDFALCEFVDTSKIEIQKIVRNGLDMLYKEMN